MKIITGLTSSPFQSLTIPDPNTGKSIGMSLRYNPRTQEWYAGLTFGTWALASVKLVYSPNILTQYSNVIPFGFMVITTDGFDPFIINDWMSGRGYMALLTTSEAEAIQAGIVAGTITG